MLSLLVDRLLANPARRGRSLRRLRLGARLAGGGSWRSVAALRRAGADPVRLRLALGRRLEELPGPATTLSLRALATGPPANDQGTLGGSAGSERRKLLAEAVRQARAIAGKDAVMRVLEVDAESRVPERRMLLTPFQEESCTRESERQVYRPQPVEVRTGPDGAPSAVDSVRVDAVREEWLVEDRWWTPRPLRRRYFELVLADGRNVVVFREPAQGAEGDRSSGKAGRGRWLPPASMNLPVGWMPTARGVAGVITSSSTALRLLLPRRGIGAGGAGAGGGRARPPSHGADRPRRGLGGDGVRPGLQVLRGSPDRRLRNGRNHSGDSLRLRVRCRRVRVLAGRQAESALTGTSSLVPTSGLSAGSPTRRSTSRSWSRAGTGGGTSAG